MLACTRICDIAAEKCSSGPGIAIVSSYNTRTSSGTSIQVILHAVASQQHPPTRATIRHNCTSVHSVPCTNTLQPRSVQSDDSINDVRKRKQYDLHSRECYLSIINSLKKKTKKNNATTDVTTTCVAIINMSKGMLAYYGERLAKKGLVGLIFAVSPEFVAHVPGGDGVYGTCACLFYSNPLGNTCEMPFPLWSCTRTVHSTRRYSNPNLTRESPIFIL